jgi:hypothetical protein
MFKTNFKNREHMLLSAKSCPETLKAVVKRNFIFLKHLIIVKRGTSNFTAKMLKTTYPEFGLIRVSWSHRMHMLNSSHTDAGLTLQGIR